jgi:hypothetical protein
MSRNSALVLALTLGSLVVPAQAFAQLTPPAGSAGAGNSPINGVPFGPANPKGAQRPQRHRQRVDCPTAWQKPSDAGRPLHTHRFITLTPRCAYAGASQRIISARNVEPRSRPPVHRRGRPQVSTFTGICRGC